MAKDVIVKMELIVGVHKKKNWECEKGTTKAKKNL
jgi:hypothetical protein